MFLTRHSPADVNMRGSVLFPSAKLQPDFPARSAHMLLCSWRESDILCGHGSNEIKARSAFTQMAFTSVLTSQVMQMNEEITDNPHGLAISRTGHCHQEGW